MSLFYWTDLLSDFARYIYMDYKKNNMNTDREKGRGNRIRACVTRG
jgi:hypothetical protein